MRPGPKKCVRIAAALFASWAFFGFAGGVFADEPAVESSAASAASTEQLTPEEQLIRLEEARQRVVDLKARKAALEAQLGEMQFEDGAAFEPPPDISDLPPDEHARGVVRGIAEREQQLAEGAATVIRTLTVEIISGKEKGTAVHVTENDLDATANKAMREGDRVVVVKSYQFDGSASYFIVDHYRLPALGALGLLFFAAAVWFGRWRGLTSVLGLISTVLVITWFVIPRVAGGKDPLATCVAAAFLIAATSLYLAHGFNTRTSVAFVSTCLSMILALAAAVAAAALARLSGMGSEDVLFLQGTGYADLDLRGLLLGGIILGVLGILDDITTAQSAIVEELKAANPSFSARDLYVRGLSVGKEHIASLINTLFLAYAGASLPLFLLFTAHRGTPLWLVLNSESIAEEIVRTLVGSATLIFAVPLTTALAAAFYAKRTPHLREADTHGHRH